MPSIPSLIPFLLKARRFGNMDGDDDLLKNFFAEIDKLPTPSAETPAEKKEVVACITVLHL